MCSFLNFSDIVEFGSLSDGILTIDKTFEIERPSGGEALCLIVNALARFEGKAPHINFRLFYASDENHIYRSHWYTIGNSLAFERKSWRVPPMIWQDMRVRITVKIPEGTKLYIRNFDADFGAPAERSLVGVRYNSHLGLIGYIPDNTLESFTMAADVGYAVCIVVPKVTKDGVFVCLHDDTINRTGRDKDGNELPEEPMYVWDMTYEELLEYDFAVRKHPIFKGTKIPLLEDFFKLCAKTGMRPMFSTHPALTKEQWLKVKEMLIRYNLLPHFHVKGGEPEILKAAFAVFGDDIDGYTLDVNDPTPEELSGMQAIGIDSSKCRAVIEIRYQFINDESIAMVRETGFSVAAWNMPHCCEFEAYERLIEMGVAEFTEDYHCSMGLNY